MLTSDVLLAVLGGAGGGAVTQTFRVWLDRHHDRRAARARVYQQMQLMRRRHPAGPPVLLAGRDTVAAARYLDDLTDLAQHVQEAWPDQTLAFALQNLAGGMSRLPSQQDSRATVLNLYLLCGRHLTILDLGRLVTLRSQPLASMPFLGGLVRGLRELRARRAMDLAQNQGPYGLPHLD